MLKFLCWIKTAESLAMVYFIWAVGDAWKVPPFTSARVASSSTDA
jgi:hypothetical protein